MPGRDAMVDEQAAIWFARMLGPDREIHELAFERWRSADSAHRQAYAEAERLWQVSAGLARTASGESRNLETRKVPFWTQPAARPAFAMVAVLLVLIAGVAFLGNRESGTVPVVAAAPQATRVGEIRKLDLPDGSTVTLDTDSAIEIRFSGEARFVRLSRGRARFDVVPDAARPFQVEAGGRTVTARGTLFDVGFEPEGVRVTLYRGAVDVRGLPAPGGVASVSRLVPGECFSDAARAPRIARAPRGSDQWVSGMLSFDGVPLAQVLDQTNRYSPRKIRLGVASLGARRVTGAFRPLPADELAASLAASFSLRLERSPEGDFVLQPK